MFRGRPYYSNDQSYVEQKNYTHVRMTFGYDRIDFQLAVQLMNAVYRKEWRLLHNHFFPQMKLVKKVREGSRIRRTMSKPVTPTDRLMANDSLIDKNKTRLTAEAQGCNPFQLRQGLRKKLRGFRLYLGKDKDKWGENAM